jgi:hypothetical protein
LSIFYRDNGSQWNQSKNYVASHTYSLIGLTRLLLADQKIFRRCSTFHR